jgi:hypothetical protein
MPISEQARTIRTAISPRLATRIFLNTLQALIIHTNPVIVTWACLELNPHSSILITNLEH